MKNFFTVIFICTILCSCTDFHEETAVQECGTHNSVADVSTRSSTESTPQFDTLPNPYALDVMQAIADSLTGYSVLLSPTDLYVRFLPADTIQLNSLINDYKLELFDYPLDLDIKEDDVYNDPTISDDDISWQYTTVPADFVFPMGLRYEILEECYIPENDDSSDSGGGDSAGAPSPLMDIEFEAFARLGYDVEQPPQGQTRALSQRPKGKISVNYTDDITKVPVKGVKVRCHTIVKWSTTYTDANGNYEMDSKFLVRPHYAVVFDNREGFDIWGQYGPIARANLNMGWHSKSGCNKNIGVNSIAWEWAIVNNAGYDYYQMCKETGIRKPPAN